MNVTPSRPVIRARAIGTVGVLSLAILTATAGVVRAASVQPVPVNAGNPTCAEFGGWAELKADPPANGTYSDGTLIVTISNFVQSSSGQPGSFDWSSNIGLDAVFVKAGTSKHNLYAYDPESTGDTALMPQAGTGNGISHISFCYDTGDPTNPPSSPPSNPPTETPSPTPPGSSSAPSVGSPSSTPDGEVSGVVGTPKLTLPPTDAPPHLAATAGSDASTGSVLAILGSLAAASLFALRRPVLRRR